MANKQFKFNVTKEDQEKEEARKQRELEAEVQQRNSIRNKKLEQLNKKQKQNKYTVIISIVVIALSLIIFGTYNTFFKQPLTVDDVNTLIRRSDAKFNDGGLEGFIYNNVAEVFKLNSSSSPCGSASPSPWSMSAWRVTLFILSCSTTGSLTTPDEFVFEYGKKLWEIVGNFW